MWTRLLVIPVILVLGLSSCPAQEKNIRAGIGVSITGNLTGWGTWYSLYGLYPGSGATGSIPVEFGRTFRIEPEFGYATFEWEYSDPNNYTEIETYKGYRIGVSAAYIIPNAGGHEQMKAAIGARIASLFYHFDEDYDNNRVREDRMLERTDLLVGLFLGGEYYPIKNFCVGGELGVNRIQAGDPSYAPEDEPASSLTGLAVYVGGTISLRWFIF
jgi:hypothetical protein